MSDLGKAIVFLFLLPGYLTVGIYNLITGREEFKEDEIIICSFVIYVIIAALVFIFGYIIPYVEKKII